MVGPLPAADGVEMLGEEFRVVTAEVEDGVEMVVEDGAEVVVVVIREAAEEVVEVEVVDVDLRKGI